MSEENLKQIQRIFTYLTVAQFCQRHPAFTVGGLRWQIFHEDTNGLRKSGAIVRNGRKILINCEKYFVWLEAQNQGVAA